MITAPTQISNCQVWLDASDTTSLFQLSGGTTAVAANLDPVGYWGDKSGNTRHFTNIGGSATTRPTWVSSLSSLRFDGSNDYLSSFFNITYTAQTVFVVVSQRVYSGNSRIYTQVSSGGTDTSQAGHYLPCLTTTTTTYGSYIGGVLRSTVSPRSLSAFEVFTSTHSSVSAINYLNGVAGSAFGSTINYAVALSRIGAAATTAGGYFNGDISEVIVYNRALTNNERADVEYYLTRKWNFLNSIPRQTYAIKNGLWSDSATWSISAEPSPWNFPLSADNAYTNTFTVTADSSTRVDTIRNSTLAPNITAGGSFVLANGVSLSANVYSSAAPYTLTLNPVASSTLVGNVFGVTSNVPALSCSGTSSFTAYGNFTGGAAAASYSLVNNSTSPCFIIGNITGGSSGNWSSVGAVVQQLGNLNITGSVYGGSGGTNVPGISQTGGTVNVTGNIEGIGVQNGFSNSGGTINVVGNVLGSSTGGGFGVLTNFSTSQTINLTGNVTSRSAAAISIASTANTRLSIYNGNVTASNADNAITTTSTTTSPLSVYGNIINAPNGRQAIYAPRYQVFPSASATYTRQAVNGYNSYADYWTSNATFTYPASSDVASGINYSNNTLSGSMAVPSASSVALGAPVGISTGTASITIDNVFGQPIANLTTSNSIGARLKNITTSQALSSVVNSLNFSN
jgi:hypothetical protein